MLNSSSAQINYRPNQKDQDRPWTTYETERKKGKEKGLETTSC